LAYWSDFYDQIYKHPDCPEEDIIDDDEKLDNWVEYITKKRDKDLKGGKRGATDNTPPPPRGKKGKGKRSIGRTQQKTERQQDVFHFGNKSSGIKMPKGPKRR
jgi:hypothetical protein